MTPVSHVEKTNQGFLVNTTRGNVRANQVVFATNGYPSPVIGRLKRNVVVVNTHMIATEELDPEVAHKLLPHDRGVSETRRVVNHYRLSPDGKRLLFGGRARFYSMDDRRTAQILHKMMLKRFPQLKDTRITHSWGGQVAISMDYTAHIGSEQGVHYALGCNGSGIVLMSYLGHNLGKKILSGSSQPISAYDTGTMPTHPLYFGNSSWYLPLLGSFYQIRDALDHHN